MTFRDDNDGDSCNDNFAELLRCLFPISALFHEPVRYPSTSRDKYDLYCIFLLYLAQETDDRPHNRRYVSS